MSNMPRFSIWNRLKYEIWSEEAGLKPKDGRCFSCDSANSAALVLLKKEVNAENQNETINKKVEAASSVKNKKPLQFLIDIVPENIFLSLNDMSLMLQVIFFAIFFGMWIWIFSFLYQILGVNIGSDDLHTFEGLSNNMVFMI